MAFLYGITGLTLATLGMRYFMITDWPMNIGGKPNFSYLDNMLAFVPISFEFTVLCAAHGMAITYLLRNKTLPGMPAQNPDPRTTDDKFVMEIRLNENHGISEAELDEMLKETGFFELDKKEAYCDDFHKCFERALEQLDNENIYQVIKSYYYYC
jgi:tRNA C32,U32 (ribose-2'-O)-methylase TrmJ